MANKKVKRGKKGKDAQPKAIPLQAYDMDVISKEDLKKYVAALEKELVLMRKDCAFYNTNKLKIMEFLDARRNEFMSKKRMSAVNNAAMDDTIEHLRKFPGKYNELKVFRDREKVRQKLENVFDDFVVNSSAEADHHDMEHVLKHQIADKDKRLELDQIFCETALMDMKGTYQNVLEDVDVKYGKKLEGFLMEKVEGNLKGNQEFNADKIRTLISIWDFGERYCSRELKESYICEMKRMQDFFHEISSNNAEVIKILRKKLADLLIENQKTNSNLKQVLLQDVDMQDLQPANLPHPRKRQPSARVQRSMGKFRDENLMKLQYRNEALCIQLRTVKTEQRNLKKQFIAATRKIYQKAEFKAFMTEEMIRMTLQMESLKSREEESKTKEYEKEFKDHEEESKTKEYEKEFKDHEEESKTIAGRVNVINLTVEKSDTLFVPPVYHAFWDPCVKYG